MSSPPPPPPPNNQTNQTGNPNCNNMSQACAQGCCDMSGNCPAPNVQCHYFYPSNGPRDQPRKLEPGAIAGLVIGGLILVVLVIFLIVYLRRKNSGAHQAEQVSQNSVLPSPGVATPYMHAEPQMQGQGGAHMEAAKPTNMMIEN